MAEMTGSCTFWHVASQRITMSDGVMTSVGRVRLAGEVVDDEPVAPRRIRTMDALVISVVTDGYGQYVDEARRTTPIGPSTVTVVKSEVPHWYGTEPGQRWTELFAVVDGPIFELLVHAGDVAVSGPRLLPRGSRPEDLALLLRRPPSPAAARLQVWAVAHWLARALTPDIVESAALWDRAEVLLLDDLAEAVSIPRVAAQLGLPYDTFRREFRRRFARSPLAYRNEKRLESAATLLSLTNLTCREVARRLGYSDEFHLSNRFRRRYGVPPAAYREAHFPGPAAD